MQEAVRHPSHKGYDEWAVVFPKGAKIANVHSLRLVGIDTICKEVNRIRNDSERFISMDTRDPNVVV